MRFGTTSASACTDRIAALAALNSCPPPSQFCVVRVKRGGRSGDGSWRERRGARDVVGARDENEMGTHVAVRHQVRVGGDVGRARGGRDAPRVGSDGGRRARGETAAARERPPHGGERERRHGRHRASRSEMRVTRHVCEKGGKDSREIWSRMEKKKSETLAGCPPWGVRCPRWRFFFGFRVVSLGGKPRHGRVRVRASFQHARVGPVVAAAPTRREAHPSHSPSQRRARSRPTPAVAHAHLPLTVHRTSETFRRSGTSCRATPR